MGFVCNVFLYNAFLRKPRDARLLRERLIASIDDPLAVTSVLYQTLPAVRSAVHDAR